MSRVGFFCEDDKSKGAMLPINTNALSGVLRFAAFQEGVHKYEAK
jgi:hypothetical protein